MKTMLLHSCCGPCSSAVLERLVGEYDVTVLYYNPNIYPLEEYEKRKAEQIRLLNTAYPCVKFLDCDYDAESYFACIKGLEGEKEGGARCTQCFKLRMGYTAQKAKELGFNCFTTTLSVSPHKNSKLLNAIGEELSAKYNIEYIVSDFKKKDGYLRSIQLSKQYNLYRQNYCGCKFSMWWNCAENVSETINPTESGTATTTASKTTNANASSCTSAGETTSNR